LICAGIVGAIGRLVLKNVQQVIIINVGHYYAVI